MKPCPECKAEVADSASACPKCGHRFTTGAGVAVAVIVGVIVGALVLAVLTKGL